MGEGVTLAWSPLTEEKMMSRRIRAVVAMLSFAVLASSSSVLASSSFGGPQGECPICINNKECENMAEACMQECGEEGGFWVADKCDPAPSDCGMQLSAVTCVCVGGGCEGGGSGGN